MPLNPIVIGDSIAAFVKASAPAPGVPVTDAQLRALWEGIMSIIYGDLMVNLATLPGTFEVTLPPGIGISGGVVPVTGLGGPAT